MTGRVEENKTVIKGLEEQLGALRTETQELMDKNGENKGKNDQLKGTNKELNEQNTALRAKLRFIEENVRMSEAVRLPSEPEEDELRRLQDSVSVEHNGEPDDASVCGEAREG